MLHYAVGMYYLAKASAPDHWRGGGGGGEEGERRRERGGGRGEGEGRREREGGRGEEGGRREQVITSSDMKPSVSLLGEFAAYIRTYLLNEETPTAVT